MSSPALEESPVSPPPPLESSPPPAASQPPSSPPPPPPSEETSPPPPPPSDETSPSPPPPSDETSPPPPPPEDSASSPQPPSSSDGNKSPPPPPKKNDNGGSRSPPPPSSSSSSKFHNSPPPPRPLGPSRDSSSKNSPQASSGNGDGTNPVPIIAGVVVGVGVLLLLALLVFLCACRKKKKRHYDYYNDHSLAPKGGHGTWSTPPPQSAIMSSEMSSGYSGPHGPALPPPHPSLALGFTKSSFSYEELAAATEGFSQAKLLGQGGFGYVHKGVLPNGKEIAVKSLKAGSGQGDREFQAEVEIISRVHHRHLVSLVGYCIAGEQKLLVYEFVPNSTLAFHLHGKGRPTMDWPTRLKIALGSAKGLAYLHEDCHPRIIHRDIKATNILLDCNFEAMVADFGLAKLSSDTCTHVSTRVMGTFGLVEWATPLCAKALEDGNYDELIDPALEGNYNPHEVACMISCAGASVSYSAKRRPKMSQIVRALEGEASLDEGINPGRGLISSSASSSDFEQSPYSTDIRKFRRTTLDSIDYASSEFGHTRESGLHPSSSSSDEMTKSQGRGPRAF
ncbi:PROLINE-RICH RECEPTOR-LIKE PROTEIN KINASE PERK4 [Salix koriyanagi]|uniref:non-specific serine/threonine protein kinase n=1 Tax=Salix koriyanagi TaxID=2511006 RepID=A0A9Q0TS25_9ROSI|nr:PROLINE-RICH RECEPTOR-LIKE PROTEIN KINASE PERK4 [Salix koriyanagi]